MMSTKDLQSLNYIAATLRQISILLRDFHLNDTAKLLDVARSDLEARIPAGGGSEHERR